MKFCWVTLTVADIDRSLDFYQKVLGLTVTRAFESAPGRRIRFLESGTGTQVELIQDPQTIAPQHTKDISLGFGVANLDEFIQSLSDRGHSLHSGPFQPHPSTRFAYLLDPDGVRIQLVEERNP